MLMGLMHLERTFLLMDQRDCTEGLGLSNALWWASYSVAQRMVWSGVGCYVCKKDDEANNENGNNSVIKPDSKQLWLFKGSVPPLLVVYPL